MISTFGAGSVRGFGFGSAGAAPLYFSVGTQTPTNVEHVFRGVDQLPNGSIVLAQNANTSPKDAVVANFGTDGDVAWARLTSDASNNQGIEVFSIASDASGNSYAVGRANDKSGDAGNTEAYIAKFNSSGAVQWQYYLGGTYIDEFMSVAVDSNGAVVAVGASRTALNTNGWLVTRWSSSGALDYVKRVSQSNSASIFARDVAIDSGNNMLVCGYRYLSEFAGILIKYNSSGAQQWAKDFGNGRLFGQGVAVDSDDNVFVSLRFDSGSIGARDTVVFKLNSSGVQQWKKVLGTSSADELARDGTITTDANGDVYIGAQHELSGTLFGMVIKLNGSDGSTNYIRKFVTSGGNSDVNHLMIGSDGNIICGGQANTNGVWTAKIPSDGTGTGTYGTLVYSSHTLTSQTGSVSIGNSSGLSESTPSLTKASRSTSYSDITSTFSITVSDV